MTKKVDGRAKAWRRITGGALVALPLLLTDCTAALTGGIPSAATSIESQLDMTVGDLLVQKAAWIHNLRVSLDQIDAASGMVVMMPATPVMAQPTAPVVMMPVSAPTVPSPTPPMSSGTVTPPSSAPTMTTIPPTPVIH